MRELQPLDTKKFEQALETGFELVAQEEKLKFELRRRVRGIDDTVCADITG